PDCGSGGRWFESTQLYQRLPKVLSFHFAGSRSIGPRRLVCEEKQMSRHIIISSLAVLSFAFASVSSDAATSHGAVRPRRTAHRVPVAPPYRAVVHAAAPRDPWAEWRARWAAEVGNCPVGWYCYPNGNR